MIELVVPELPQQELTLDSIDPVRGDAHPAGGGPPPLAGRIFLGGPHGRPLTREFVAADPDLAAYVERELEYHSYYLVYLNVSFAAEPAAPRLATATLDLKLSTTGNTSEPVALSMTPRQITDSVQVQRSVRFGPKLALMDVEATLGEVSKSTTRDEREVFLQALRQLRSDPTWEFRRTKTMDISGAFDLAMVVRTERDAAIGVTCTVTASTKGNLLRWYRQELAGPLQVGTVL
ncbi:hypothetical protein [Streptomyces prunicolor]|uniref:DUF1795 domain-containing protein n=1 Tax=Streptomyces prunicolor TaxID=67348 RepID=A0ABU4F7E7_9ACTN|nr:hypothetical protein [Streptomyces prunicolor]MDV7215225.1 hypothetical protein [Streptomyces prunicolor]